MTVSFNVTRRRLVLGARDSTTGHRLKTWSETTIEMVVLPRGSSYLSLVPGVFVRLDAVGLTCDGVEVGDEIEDFFGVFYEVKGIKPWPIGDSFMYRSVDLTELPLHT